jgi:hypothetical protein
LTVPSSIERRSFTDISRKLGNPRASIGLVASDPAASAKAATEFLKEKGRPLAEPPLPSADASRRPRNLVRSLLQLDGSAGFLDLLLDLLGLVLVDAFLDRLWSAFDQRLRLAEAKAGDRRGLP